MTELEKTRIAAEEIAAVLRDYPWTKEDPCWAHSVIFRTERKGGPRGTITAPDYKAINGSVLGPIFSRIRWHYLGLGVAVFWDDEDSSAEGDHILWSLHE
jgi:hypothetical protein